MKRRVHQKDPWCFTKVKDRNADPRTERQPGALWEPGGLSTSLPLFSLCICSPLPCYHPPASSALLPERWHVGTLLPGFKHSGSCIQQEAHLSLWLSKPKFQGKDWLASWDKMPQPSKCDRGSRPSRSGNSYHNRVRWMREEETGGKKMVDNNLMGIYHMA